MAQANSNALQNLLDSPWASRVRRNHGLEHATLHVLSRRFPTLPMAGHSDAGGFWILGEIPTDALQSAVGEALDRLRSGEHRLAVHPNCGTNFVTSGVLAGGAAGLAMFGAGRRLRDQLDRLPYAMLLATVALVIAQPLGLQLQQRITTSGSPGDLVVIEIQLARRGGIPAHRVVTAG